MINRSDIYENVLIEHLDIHEFILFYSSFNNMVNPFYIIQQNIKNNMNFHSVVVLILKNYLYFKLFYETLSLLKINFHKYVEIEEEKNQKSIQGFTSFSQKELFWTDKILGLVKNYKNGYGNYKFKNLENLLNYMDIFSIFNNFEQRSNYVFIYCMFQKIIQYAKFQPFEKFMIPIQKF